MSTPVTKDGCPRCGATFRSWGVPPIVCYCDEPEPNTWMGVKPFVPYFDTALGVQITGPRHKARVLKERGLVEVGGEFEKHIMGKTLEPAWESPVTEREVAEKLSEIRERFKYDREYRIRHGGSATQETD